MAKLLLRPPKLQHFCSATALRSVFLPSGSASVRPLHPQRVLQRRSKTSRAAADLAQLEAQEAELEARRRMPRALRWAHPDRDEGIAAPTVMVLDPRTQRPGPPRPLVEVLQNDVDRQAEFLVRVGASANTDGAPPLCRIVAKKDEFAREQARGRAAAEAKKAARRREGKTIELGWATADGDLSHRFRKAREALTEGGDSGARVTFVIENRQRRTVVAPEAAQRMVQRVCEAMRETPGASEVGREGRLGGKMKLTFGTGSLS